MLDPITKESYEEMYSRWIDIMCVKKENGLEIWPPISGSHRRIRQFLNDIELKNSLEKKYKSIFVEIDLEEQSSPNINVISDYVNKKNKRVCIFLFGIDTNLKQSLDILKSFATLLEKNTQISLILFTEVNITENNQFNLIMPKSVLFQNIYYQKLYEDKDSLQFLHYLQDKWNFKIDKNTCINLVKQIGGQFLIIKESARLIKKYPTFSIPKILKSPILILKGKAIFHQLNKKDKETILKILNKDIEIKVSDNLLNLGIVSNNHLNIKYWEIIKEDLINSFPENIKTSIQLNLDLILTSKEREVFELMLETTGIIDREKIGKTLWGVNWEDQYSDWAIDQIIHRIREKIVKSKLPYKIRTKKGLGFVLLEK